MRKAISSCLADAVMPAPARLLFRARYRIALLAVEQDLRDTPLHDRGRRPLDAHRESIGIGQAAADVQVRRERILLHSHGCLRFQFIQARHGDFRVLLERAVHGLLQFHGMHFRPQSGGQARQGDDASPRRHAGIVSDSMRRAYGLRDNESMNGIQFLTDEKGRKVSVVIDLKKHGAALEDFWDGLISESRRRERRAVRKDQGEPCETRAPACMIIGSR